jgi:ubiquitin carboxyl-terminal hydrolase 9/24
MQDIEWLQTGRLIDVKGNDNTWKVGVVISIQNDNALINFDGWSTYSSTFPISSKRLAPFRRYTLKYTGMATTKRNWNITESEMVQMEKKVSKRLENLYCKSPYETTQFYRGELFIFIENLIDLDYKNYLHVLDRIVSFFTSVIILISKLLQEYTSLFSYYYKGLEDPELFTKDNLVALASTWPEVLDTLNKLLCMEPRCRKFFFSYHNYPSDYIFCDRTLKKENYSETFLYLLNKFASIDGFESTIKIVNNIDESNKVPITFLNTFTLYALKDFIDPGYYSSFADRMSLGVISRIKLVDEKDLKYVEPETIISLLQFIKTEGSLVTSSVIETSYLTLYCKMLRSSYMEKRIKGINEISSYLDNLKDHNLTENQIFNIFESEELVIEILETRVHEEILRRSGQILKIYAKFGKITKKECEIIWAFSQDKQKIVSEAGYGIIIEISPWIQNDLKDYFYNQLISFPHSELPLQTIIDFSIKILENSNLDRVYGNDLLLNLTSNPNKFKEAIDLLIKLYRVPQASHLRTAFLKELPEKLKKLESIPQFLSIVIGLLNQLPLPQLIETCESLKIKENILSSISAYSKAIKKSENKIKSRTQLFNSSHFEQIRSRLVALEYIFNKTEFKVYLSSKELKSLWRKLVTEKNSSKDPQMFFKSINSGLEYGSLINNYSEVFENLFLDSNYFPDSSVSIIAFKAFKFFFFKANQPENIELENQRFKSVKNKEIKGLEKLVNLFLEGNDKIVKSALKLLKSLVTYYFPAIISDAPYVLDKLLGCFMGRISNGNSNIIEKTLEFLIKLLDLEVVDSVNQTFYIFYDNKYHQVELPLKNNVRSLRKIISQKLSVSLAEVTLKIEDRVYSHVLDNKILTLKRDKPVFLYPDSQQILEYQSAVQVIANNKKVIKFILEKAMTDQKSKEKAWYLLSKLPASDELETNIKTLEKPIDKIIPKSSIEFLFSLYTLKKYSQDKSWLNKFLDIDGCKLICNRYISLKSEKKITLMAKQEEVLINILDKVLVEDSLSKECLIALFQTLKDTVTAFDQLEDPSEFISNIKNILEYYSVKFQTVLVEVCRNTLVKTFEDMLNFFICTTDDEKYLFDLLDVIVALAKTSKTANYILKSLEKFKTTAIEVNKSIVYWKLFEKVCKIEDVKDSLLSDLGARVLEDIEKLTEVSAHTKSLNLYGLLGILKVCNDKSVVLSLDLSSMLFDLLLKIPDQPSSLYPRCKHKETRKLGYKLIVSICKRQPESLNQLLDYLSKEYYQTMQWRSSKHKNWHILTTIYEKSRLGYVGLKNPGCICYMNSLFQQLYFVNSFKNSLLQTLFKDDTILYQIKNIFSLLKYSDKMFISPRKFCRNFKDFDNKPVNIFEQMDADEFFGRLMERLEDELKSTKDCSLIQNHFGGVQVVETLSKQCDHTKERYELTLSVPVDVKNKNSLIESLKTLVQGELLQGENAYYCDLCQKKVPVLMRTSLKYLPNYLVFALRRFEFNYDTMSRNKIDDYFEFPLDLDMKEFTVEYLNNKQIFSDFYYQYKLKGVVLHHGKAEQGHYYSFINNGNTWLEFNDSMVSEINLETVKQYGFGENNNSKSVPTAYILIYERDTKFEYNNPDKIIDTPIEDASDLVNLAEISKKNQEYWIKRFIMSQDFVYFNHLLIKNYLCITPFALKFFMTILLRLDRFYSEKFTFFSYLQQNIDSNSVKILLDTITSENGVKEFLVFCPNPLSRKLIALLTKSAIKSISQENINSYFLKFARTAKYITKNSPGYFTQYLELLVCFGEHLKDFKKDYEIVKMILKLVLGQNEVPYVENNDENHLGYIDGYPNISDKTFDSLGKSFSPALQFLSKFTNEIEEEYAEQLISQKGFEFFFKILDNKASKQAYAKILLNLLVDQVQFSINLGYFLVSKCTEEPQETNKNYLIVLSLFLKSHPHKAEIVKNIIDYYTSNIPSQNLEMTQQLISYLLKLLNKISFEDISENFSDTKIDQIKDWLNVNMKYKINDEVFDNPILLKYYNKMCSIKENINYDDVDSDDEFPDKSLEPQTNLLFFDNGRKQWLRGKVVNTIENEIVLIEYFINGSSNKILKDLNYDEVLPKY